MHSNEVSIVMPVYNSEKFLNEAIESMLNQTYKDFEFIIINDGSNDSSLDIINYYRRLDSRIRIIDRENKGLVYSLNEAIASSKGKYIVRMDSDDVSYLNRIELQLEYLKDNPQIDILGTCVEIIGNISEERKKLEEHRLNRGFVAGLTEETIITHWYCLAHPSIIAKKEVYITLNGYRNVISEDLDIWLRALKAGINIGKMQEKLIKYRIHIDSKSIRDNLHYEGIKNSINLKLKYIKDYKKYIKNNVQYVIWGASNGGKLTKEVVESMIPNSNLIAYIDSYKDDKFDNFPIFKPKDLYNLSFDYVFVATEPGKEIAISFLDEMGFKNLKDYLCTI